MRSSMRRPIADRVRTLSFRSVLIAGSLLLGGCIFGSNGKSSAPCSGIANQYAASSVSEAQCASEPRGEWFDGRCYCHSSAENAQR